MAKGFVYVLSNAALSGLVKIGFTTKVPTLRAAELASTGIPAPFVVEYYCLCEGADKIERLVHNSLANKRYSNDREFFSVTIEEAIKNIELTSKSSEHTWRNPSHHLTNPPAAKRPPRVTCQKCGAYYVSATHCPKCQVKLVW